MLHIEYETIIHLSLTANYNLKEDQYKTKNQLKSKMNKHTKQGIQLTNIITKKSKS